MQSSRFQIPVVLVIFLIAIAIINGFADAYHWYWTHRWFDNPMHFAGGAWLASFGFWWQYRRRNVPLTGFVALLGVCLVFSLGVGLLWEGYEAMVGFLTVGHINAMSDTLSDLLFDILGSITVAGLIWGQSKLKTTKIS